MTEVVIISSPQSSTQYRAVLEQGQEYIRNIVVEKNASKSVVVVVMPGVSVDVKFDVTLAGEGAQANIYGAYVCGADE